MQDAIRELQHQEVAAVSGGADDNINIWSGTIAGLRFYFANDTMIGVVVNGEYKDFHGPFRVGPD